MSEVKDTSWYQIVMPKVWSPMSLKYLASDHDLQFSLEYICGLDVLHLHVHTGLQMSIYS